MVLFQGNDVFAYRDPTCTFFRGKYYLFFTLSEKENGYMYNRVAMSSSEDLFHWSTPKFLTKKDRNLNFCSPGNVICQGDDYVLCITSYPMPQPFAEYPFANETARIYTMRTKDFETFSEPQMLLPKGDTPAEELGRMIDPYIIQKEDFYYLFYKQNGASFSRSKDLQHWEYLGHANVGENVCVLQFSGEYLMLHQFFCRAAHNSHS